MKTSSAFYAPKQLEKARRNIEQYSWARQAQEYVVSAARPWLEYSDDELWHLMFGPTIPRSWMVWSDGHCPCCKQDVRMYNWKIDALKEPWKLHCPHCEERFPKNDFGAFYRSGLDEHNVFDPQRADRSLLFNTEHPDPTDPLHHFGVDDGNGYTDGNKCWRFIGAYLVYGQWKQAVVGGIHNLATAYALTGDKTYARKTGVLLDRVADLYPDFDYFTQAFMYDKPAAEIGSVGYVSYWCDACDETREMIICYDIVFEALREDRELFQFLSQKAAQYKLANAKQSWEDVQRNIEERILREAIVNRVKIRSNYPRTDMTVTIANTVLGWPHNCDEVNAMIDGIVEQSTSVDGVTGEKGLSGYSAFAIQGLAMFLGKFSRLDESWLRELVGRHPRLAQTYRFHIDTWCLDTYYPAIGDCGWFAKPVEEYQGLAFRKQSDAPKTILWEWGLVPSMFTLLWDLYQITGDVAFVKLMYRANDNSIENLPHDLFAGNPAATQQAVQEIIEREGSQFQLGSIDKKEWHLAILRGGQGQSERAVWLDYDAGGNHAHSDAMNLGLFAYGLDLMPDCGYPAVMFGGWQSPQALWYGMAAAHNTVVIDGQKEQHPTYSGIVAGETRLWAVGTEFQAMRMSAPEIIQGRQFERTVAMINISEHDFYLVDIFRVSGGHDHAKFMHSHFSTINISGLQLQPAADYGYDTQMRNFQGDARPQPGWSADWKIEDRYKLQPPDKDIHLRYTDFTTGAAAFTCEGWVASGSYDVVADVQQEWIPRLMVRRSNTTEPLTSTFAGVIEPYEGSSKIAGIRRLPLFDESGTEYSDGFVALEIELVDGRRDLFVAADIENSTPEYSGATFVQPEWNLRTDAEVCRVRLGQSGEVEQLSICRGREVRIGEHHTSLKTTTEYYEWNS